jgi:hypothetical protein
MNQSDIKLLRTLISDYWKSLELVKVQKEFLENGLLNINSKLQKGLEDTKLVIYGLELIPSNYTEGLNLCPKADTCKNSCLAFSGHASLIKLSKGSLNDTIKKRVRRTFLFKKDRKFFEEILKLEIEHKNRLASFDNTRAVFRLNTFSDIDWKNFISSLPEISFYDYTKVWNRKPLKNYSLTYSVSTNTSKLEILSKLHSGNSIAVVFEGKALPESFLGFKVFDGNTSDLRILDKSSSVIGLTLKRSIGLKEDSKSEFSKYALELV